MGPLLHTCMVRAFRKLAKTMQPLTSLRDFPCLAPLKCTQTDPWAMLVAHTHYSMRKEERRRKNRKKEKRDDRIALPPFCHIGFT